MNNVSEKALVYLKNIIGKPLCNAWKSPDTELYEFVFGDRIDKKNKFDKEKTSYVLHVLCQFYIVNHDERTLRYYNGDSSYLKFQKRIEKYFDKCPKNVEVGENNMLRIDFGGLWLDFWSYENEPDEAWRFFKLGNDPHLVVYYDKIRFDM